METKDLTQLEINNEKLEDIASILYQVLSRNDNLSSKCKEEIFLGK